MDTHVERIDPRDQTWEDSQPIYRVYFHDAVGASDEYEVQAWMSGQFWTGQRRKPVKAPTCLVPACLKAASDC